MSAYLPINLKRFRAPGLSIFSAGEYKLVTGTEVHEAQFIALKDGAITKDSNDFNKIWVDQYGDTSSITGALGITINRRDDVDTSDVRYAGMGPYRRDLTILHKGTYSLYFYSGLVKTQSEFGMRIAPHPSGFVDWRTGLACVGTVIQPGVGTGNWVECEIDCRKTEVSYI
jgi:hypothetical protein